jgi:hypothetical protein
MNTIKKLAGILWIALGLYAGYFSLTSLGYPKLQSGLAGNASDLVFGLIVTLILTPLIVGALLTFGYYCLSGEYNDTRVLVQPEESK